MSRHKPPSYTVEGLKHRLSEMERNIDDLFRRGGWDFDDEFGTGSGGGGPAVIDMGDSAVYTGYSKTYHPLRAATLSRVVATLTAAGSSATLANIYKNSTQIGTVEVPIGALKSSPLTLTTTFTDADFWQVLVTQAGTGASGLTFYGDFV